MKTFLIVIISLNLMTHTLAKHCECGVHATGITVYNTNGDDCCTSPVSAGAGGAINYYTQNEQGT